MKKWIGFSTVLYLALCSAESMALEENKKRRGFHFGVGQWGGEITGLVAGTSDKKAYEALANDPDTAYLDARIPTFSERGFLITRHVQYWIGYTHNHRYWPKFEFYYTNVEHTGRTRAKFLIDTKPGFLPDVPPGELNPPLYVKDIFSTEMLMDVFDLHLSYNIDKLSSDKLFLGFSFVTDLGITLRTMQGDFLESLDERNLRGYRREAQTKNTPIDLTMPLLFNKLEIQAPRFSLFRWPVDIYANAVNIYSKEGKSEMIDIDLEIGAMTDIFDGKYRIGGFAGYRYAKLKTPEMNGLFSDTFLEGARGGMRIEF